MGDLPGHPFRGNQYSAGTHVKWSESALRPERERASMYIRKYGERPEHRAYDKKLAQRGVIVGVAHAEKDVPNIMRRKGDFIGYDVKFEGEQGVHKVSPHMVERDVEHPKEQALEAERLRRENKLTVDFEHPGRTDRGVDRSGGVQVSRGDYNAVKRAPRGTQRVTALLKIADKLTKVNPGGLLAMTRKRGHGAQ